MLSLLSIVVYKIDLLVMCRSRIYLYLPHGTGFVLDCPTPLKIPIIEIFRGVGFERPKVLRSLIIKLLKTFGLSKPPSLNKFQYLQWGVCGLIESGTAQSISHCFFWSND